MGLSCARSFRYILLKGAVVNRVGSRWSVLVFIIVIIVSCGCLFGCVVLCSLSSPQKMCCCPSCFLAYDRRMWAMRRFIRFTSLCLSYESAAAEGCGSSLASANCCLNVEVVSSGSVDELRSKCDASLWGSCSGTVDVPNVVWCCAILCCIMCCIVVVWCVVSLEASAGPLVRDNIFRLTLTNSAGLCCDTPLS